MAADTALDYMKTRVGGLGGVIVVNSSGEWAARFSTKQMSWAAVKDDQLHYGIYAGERHTKSVDEALTSESEGFWKWRNIDWGRIKISSFCWRTMTVDLIFLKELYSFDWVTGIPTFIVKIKSGHSPSVVMDICIVFINTFRKSGDPSFLDKNENGQQVSWLVCLDTLKGVWVSVLQELLSIPVLNDCCPEMNTY